ncbi:MAG TPA: TIGR02594 family protein, partial [Actinomycetes bacterium]|nr:TIGR02594 family protein [Actinomycetes bacterium]
MAETALPDDPPWLRTALEELGDKVSRIPGAGDHPRILEYLQTTTVGHPFNQQDHTHWCSAFVNFCVEQSGNPGTDSAVAKSWLDWGRPTTTPVRGCVVVFTRNGGGHVGFYLGHTSTHIRTL